MVAAALWPASGLAQARHEESPLALYQGRWTSTAHMNDTAFSKAQEVTAKLSCSWTGDHEFLVCDQIITDARGTHSQLTVYSYNPDDKSYRYSTIPSPGMPGMGGKMEVEDHRFVYSGSSEQNGKKTLFRTTNLFSAAGDSYTFVAEFSTDEGAHWTKMVEGTTKKKTT